MWYASQIGRREHYSIPSEIYRRQMLSVFCTDIWAGAFGEHLHSLMPKKFRQRFSPELAKANVRSMPLISTLRAHRKRGNEFVNWVEQGMCFGKFSSNVFRKFGIGTDSTVFGYTCGNLEQLKLGQMVGARTIHVQISPGPLWYETREAEQHKYPKYEPKSPPVSKEFLARISEEIRTADHVVVHSEHSRQSLDHAGFDVSKTHVIPPAFENRVGARQESKKIEQPKRILFVGKVCLAKGFHIFAQAAVTLGSQFEFIAAGQLAMNPEYIRSCENHLKFTGHLTSIELKKLIKSCDVLVFPTLSDGFGLVQLEAMSAGLPVISTTNCGSVVRDGVDGFVVPTGRHEPIVERLLQLAGDSELYASQSSAALSRVRDFSPEKQLNALLQLK